MVWKPQIDQPVGPDEPIGRRLFSQPSLVGAQDQKPLLKPSLRHFEDTRGQVSLDRLGQTGVEKAVVKYLRPRADRAGTKLRPPKAFNGWAVLRARQFGSPPAPQDEALSVVASPQDGHDLDENLYHAHVVNPDIKPYYLALHLRHLFVTYGTTIDRQGRPNKSLD